MRLLKLSAVVIGLVIATANGVSAQTGERGSITAGMDARDISSLDPAYTTNGADEFIVRQIYNSLISPPDGTLDVGLDQIQGELAESWEVSEDGSTWTFKLRADVPWQKGYGSVSASDVKFTFDRLRDPEAGTPYSGSYESIEEVEVLDELTVAFHLSSPSAFFHVSALLPRFGAYIVPQKAVEELGEDFGLNPVGSGPYQFVEYRSKQGVKVEAFDDYFGGTPGLAAINFRYMPDSNARTLAFIGGDLDLIEGVREPGWTDELNENMEGAQIDALFPGSTQTVFLNMEREPLDNLKVRQAIAYAVDRGVWSEAYGKLNQPLVGPIPPQFYGGMDPADIPEELWYKQDVEKAKQLLAEAGYPDGVTIEANISERADYKTNMLLLQDQLRDVGINIDLRLQDHTSYHAANNENRNSLIILSTTQPPNALPVLRTFYHSASDVSSPTGSRNYSHYGVDGGGVDRLLDAAENELDPSKQIELLHEAQLQILRDVPVVPLQSLAVIWVRQPHLQLDFEPTAGLGHYPLAFAKVTE